MLIALDYDKTYTLDREFWDIVVYAANRRGHEVICVTMRHEHEGAEVVGALGGRVQIIFTGRKAKSDFLKNLGIEPSVWIDDQPFWLFNDSA